MIVAINQIGIAANLVNTLFIGVVAAVALAFGLAFGLGGRDVAAQLTQRWYEQSQDAAARVKAHAEGSTTEMARPPAPQATGGQTASGPATAKPAP